MKKFMTLIFKAFIIINEENFCKGMAVPKSRRSKTKGKIRLANWKRKANDAAKKAFNEAKKVFAKEKKEESPLTDGQTIELEKDISSEEN